MGPRAARPVSERSERAIRHSSPQGESDRPIQPIPASGGDEVAADFVPEPPPEVAHIAQVAHPVRGGGVRGFLRRHAVDTRPVAIPAYRRLLIGQGTSFIGSMLTQVAVPVQVYALSGSSLYVGLVGLAGLVPIVVFGLYGGAIADSMDRRTLYLWSSVGTWAVTLGLLVQTLLGVGSVGLILVLVSVQSAFFAISSSARGAIIPRIVETDLVPAANTLNFTVGNIGQVIGPLFAGFLVTVDHGFEYAYALDALLFTAALYSVFRLPSIAPDGSAPKLGLRSVAEGLAFIATRPVLLMSFVVDIVAMVFAMPRALFPAVADARFGGAVGPLYAAIAIGSVVAGLSSGWIGRVRRQGVALVIAIVGWGGAVALSGLARQLWLVVALLALAGAADLVSAVYRQTILQTYAPDEMRGRMQGVFIAVVAGGPRLGDLRAGGTAAATSTTFSWVGGGIACMIVVAIAGVLVRPFWRYDARRVREPEAVASAP
jgi:MFS family permease